ncbi:hypothetical protein [Aquipuribacter nitratireducens]|uniref:Uncharacterized protein n=1 Tax=Aquipuribacter nitratireducens TaxID=650104 RepID=A0ABW0GK89_9MICO
MSPRRGLLAVLVVSAVLVGVLVVRGGSAVAPGDLAALRAEPSSSPVPSELGRRGDPDVLRVDANGVPGLRLGQAVPDSLVGPLTLPDGTLLPCEEASPFVMRSRTHPVLARGGYRATGWVQDGLVTSVRLTTDLVPDENADDVDTWLGVTIGSPVAAAAELPGARTHVERPFGRSGPLATVVVVPLPGDREAVVAAVSAGLQSWSTQFEAGPLGDEVSLDPDPAAARVTSIELRTRAARVCDFDPLLEWYDRSFEGEPGLVVDGAGGHVRVDGTRFRLGEVADLAAAGFRAQRLESEGPCVRWRAEGDAVTATTVDGRLTAIASAVLRDAAAHEGDGGPGPRDGFAWPALGIGTGSAASDVAGAARRELGPGAVRPVARSAGGPLTVRLAGDGDADVPDVRVRLELVEDIALVGDVDQPVFGSDPRIDGVTLVLAGADTTC